MRKNEMKLEFDSRSCNEGFARVAVAAFLTQLNPTLEEVADVKTAVSEAVTNVIIHMTGKRKRYWYTAGSRVRPYGSRSSITDGASQMLRRQWNRSIRHGRSATVRGWDLHSWMRSWTRWR